MHDELVKLLSKQIGNFFNISSAEMEILSNAIPLVVEKTEYCFKFVTNKYYCNNRINPLHSAQYAIFLYFYSNLVAKELDDGIHAQLASKIYYLNKIMNSVEMFYEVELPSVFCCDHPLGSVMGRARYSDFFYFSQGCTVGNNHDKYPTFGENVTMFANATIVGNCTIGRNVAITANCYIKDQDIPDNCLVFGASPELKIVHKDAGYMKNILRQFRLSTS